MPNRRAIKIAQSDALRSGGGRLIAVRSKILNKSVRGVKKTGRRNSRLRVVILHRVRGSIRKRILNQPEPCKAVHRRVSRRRTSSSNWRHWHVICYEVSLRREGEDYVGEVS